MIDDLILYSATSTSTDQQGDRACIAGADGLPPAGVRLRPAGNRSSLVLFAATASSTRFERLQARHAPLLPSLAPLIAQNELAARNRSARFPASAKRRAPNGRRPKVDHQHSKAEALSRRGGCLTERSVETSRASSGLKT